MIEVMKRIQRDKSDASMNIQQGLRGIQAKNMIEDISGKRFVKYGPGPNEEQYRPMVEAKLKELEQEGFGFDDRSKPPGHNLRKKLLKQWSEKKKKEAVNIAAKSIIRMLIA